MTKPIDWDHFEQLEDGWDGPRSKAIPRERLRQAKQIVADAPAGAWMSADSYGALYLRWSAPGRLLDIELNDDGTFFCETARDGDKAKVVADGPTEDVVALVCTFYQSRLA